MADKTEFLQAIDDAITDADSLEKFINGSEDETVLTRLSSKYPTLQNAISQINGKLDKADAQIKQSITTLFENGGLPATPFKTKALMTASTLIDGKYAQVTDDTVNNGLYVKTAGAWVKSAYDPLSYAKTEALASVASMVDTDDMNTDDLISEVDSNGSTLRKITKDGKHLFIGLDTDLVSKFDEVDVSDLIASGAGDDILNVKDGNGNIAIKQDRFGDIYAPRVGNITQSIIDLQSKSGNSEGINLQAAHLAGKYADYGLMQNIVDYNETNVLLKGGDINALEIFPHNVTAVRIPAITRIGKTKYLLHFEAREGQSDFASISLGVATINIDITTKAVTLSDIKSMHNSFTDSGGKLRTFMNACSVKLDSGKIICLYARRQGLVEHELYMRTSVDDGATWSDFTDISYVKASKNWNGMFACSQGLVKRYGQHKGRIVFPVWTTGVAYLSKDFRSGYIYSDDDGTTWKLGEFAPYATANEVQIAEDLNGDMLFSIRLESKDPPKIISRLSDKTKKFSEVLTNKSLTDEKIMSGLIQGENKYDFSANKFQLVTAKNSNRTDLLIHTSYDGGTTWRSLLLPSTIGKSVGYSCIESISAEYKFLLWETGGFSTFMCAVISLNNLIEVV